MLSQIKDSLSPTRTALIVWDVHEALVASIFNREDFLRKASELVDAARTKGICIFYTKVTPLPEKFESKARLLMWRGRKRFEPGDIVKEIYPRQGDVVLNKNTASIFVGTNFEYMARNASLSSLVFTGIATEMGVESSARHALNLGFLPVIAKEAVSSSDKDAHLRSLVNMGKLMPVLSNEEILSVWS
ncbi:MAG TPA: isochorismatase family cysteine hydrolase [Candidatus Acidoferrum sp.]|nr:isochorismatase family cysteine hydrolase [Candidatus Acidoferrum sp.]